LVEIKLSATARCTLERQRAETDCCVVFCFSRAFDRNPRGREIVTPIIYQIVKNRQIRSRKKTLGGWGLGERKKRKEAREAQENRQKALAKKKARRFPGGLDETKRRAFFYVPTYSPLARWRAA
jgi:hypothetical protein